MPRKPTAMSNPLEAGSPTASNVLDARPGRQSSLGGSECHSRPQSSRAVRPYNSRHPRLTIANDHNLDGRFGDNNNLILAAILEYSTDIDINSNDIEASAFEHRSDAGQGLAEQARSDPDRTVALGPLSDPVRRAMVERLAERPCSVGRLASGFPISRAAISQHLKVLLNAGLVDYRKRGALNVYSVNPEPLLRLNGYLRDLCREAEVSARARRDDALAVERA